MAKRLKDYLSYLEALTGSSSEGKMNPDKMKQEVLIQIRFFQHEQLLHLIMTVTFAILAMLSLVGACSTGSLGMLVLMLIIMLIFLALFLLHMKHVCLLKSGVWKMYEYYDKF